MKGVEEMIRQAFLYVLDNGPLVAEGHYDLVGPNGEIILPQLWESVIEPDWSITMHMRPFLPKPPRSGPLTPHRSHQDGQGFDRHGSRHHGRSPHGFPSPSRRELPPPPPPPANLCPRLRLGLGPSPVGGQSISLPRSSKKTASSTLKGWMLKANQVFKREKGMVSSTLDAWVPHSKMV